MARSEPIAEASLPDILARCRPGTAMAAMMLMIATTISNSIKVKPPLPLSLITLLLQPRIFRPRNSGHGYQSATFGDTRQTAVCHVVERDYTSHGPIRDGTHGAADPTYPDGDAASQPTSTAAAITVVHSPFLSPTAVWVTFWVRTI